MSDANLMNRVMGSEADCLWGPELDLMVKAPPSLANIQALGAARRLRCFLGPRGIVALSSETTKIFALSVQKTTGEKL